MGGVVPRDARRGVGVVRGWGAGVLRRRQVGTGRQRTRLTWVNSNRRALQA
jgi:hypothetical protein